MAPAPFEGLNPARSADHAGWIVEAMTGRAGVALVVPVGFAAYARLLHPLGGGRRWSEAAPAYLAEGVAPYPYPFPRVVESVEGDMGAELVDALVPALGAATSTPHRCHFALWSGWGEFHAGSHTSARARPGAPLERVRALGRQRKARRAEAQGESALGASALDAFVASCAVQPWWGGRDMLLFDGPLPSVIAVGTRPPLTDRLRRRSPQWWWPNDRQWFVGTEIDYPWSYVAGPRSLIEALMSDANIELVPADPTWRW